jgi:hypothetical protein
MALQKIKFRKVCIGQVKFKKTCIETSCKRNASAASNDVEGGGGAVESNEKMDCVSATHIAAASATADRLRRNSGYKNFMCSCRRSSSGNSKLEDASIKVAGNHRDGELAALRSSMP